MEEVGIKGWNSDIFVAVWIIATVMAIAVLMVAWVDEMKGDAGYSPVPASQRATVTPGVQNV